MGEIPIREELKQRGMLEDVERHCKNHQITLDELTGKGRSQRIMACRKDVARWLRGLDSPWSWPEIGKLLRRSSHAIVWRYFTDEDRP